MLLLYGPFCASTCGFVMVVCQGTPSWHLGANRHPKISMSRVPSCTTARPPQTMQLQFQNTALVPAFRELRAHDIYASTPKLAASQSCAHGDLSHRPTLPTYLFFHSQDRCIETPPLHRDARIEAHLCAGVCCTQRNDRIKGSVGFRYV